MSRSMIGIPARLAGAVVVVAGLALCLVGVEDTPHRLSTVTRHVGVSGRSVGIESSSTKHNQRTIGYASPTVAVPQLPGDVALLITCNYVSQANVHSRSISAILTRYDQEVINSAGVLLVPGNLFNDPTVTRSIDGVADPSFIQAMHAWGDDFPGLGSTKSAGYLYGDLDGPQTVTYVKIYDGITNDRRTLNFASAFDGKDQSCRLKTPNASARWLVWPSDGPIGPPGKQSRLPTNGTAKVSAVAGPNETVIGNVTVVNPSGAGFATVYGCADGLPNTSNANFGPGQTIANGVIVKADANGDLCITVSQATDLLWDQAGTTSAFTTQPAVRKLDTR
jgi:hypothetical protein